MFTYGYIREATMAHLDLDEEEAQAMHLLERFHIYANEAMQAICASKPMYKYIEVTVVKEFAPVVYDEEKEVIRPATEQEIAWDVETDGERPDGVYPLLNEEMTTDYYHDKMIYKTGEKVQMPDNFLTFADKQATKKQIEKPTELELYNALYYDTPIIPKVIEAPIELDNDLSFVSRNAIKFYKPGEYKIPARFLWYRFDSAISDETEIDIPSDILLTIPLYIASICLQIDNPQRAQLKRQEFEMALARCVSMDFMSLNKIKGSW